MLNFDGIMQDAQALGCLTTSEFDHLTDVVASGAKTEASAECRHGWGRDGPGEECSQPMQPKRGHASLTDPTHAKEKL